MYTGRQIKQSNELLAVIAGKKSIEACKALGKAPKKKVQHEAAEQEALIRWVNLQMKVYPQLEMLYAVPNGGSRHKLEAANLKKQGVRSGVPDLCLPVPSKVYHGMYIEMKAEKGKISENQDKWIKNLEKYGYRVEVCYGWEEAKDVIMSYLKEVK